MPVSRAVHPLLLAVAMAVSMPPVASAQTTVDPLFEFLMARRLDKAGDLPGALAALERASSADPGSAEIRAEIASVYLKQSRRDDAEKAAREALAIDSGSVEAHRVLGTIYTTSADAAVERRQNAQAVAYSREAIVHLEQVVTQPGADINLHFALGRLYLRVNEPAKAVEALNRVIAQNPNSVAGRLTLAQAYAAADRLNDAIESLKEIVEDEPRVAGALAQYQEQAGQLKEAEVNYTLALALQPRSREFKFRRASVALAAREFSRAASYAAEAQREHPDDARFPRLQARALFDGGAPARAYAVLEAALEAFPRDIQMQFALAAMYNEGDRAQDSVRVLRQLIAVEPANAPALNYLGYLLADRGEQLEEAVSLVRRALQVDPDNPAYLDSLGWAHFRRGELDEAEKYLTPAAEKMPRSSVVQDHLGDLQARRGRWTEAIAQWTRALEGDGEDIDRSVIERKIQDARAKTTRQ
jgi:tetratricopeptide (TPR) repeat protein